MIYEWDLDPGKMAVGYMTNVACVLCQFKDANGNISDVFSATRNNAYSQSLVSAFPYSGSFVKGTTVTLITNMPDLDIYYTLDGSNPEIYTWFSTGSSLGGWTAVPSPTAILYTGPLVLQENCVLMCVALGYEYVKAVQSGGGTSYYYFQEPLLMSYTYTIAQDAIAPYAILTGLPNRYTEEDSATITVSSMLSDATAYKYKLEVDSEIGTKDYGSEIAIGVPISVPLLKLGPSVLSVIVRDSVGNWQSVPTIAYWTKFGKIMLSGYPYQPTMDTNAIVHVEGEGLEYYKYAINDGSWSPYIAVANPLVVSGLQEGTVALRVKGRFFGEDSNISSVAVWQVDLTPPLMEAVPKGGITLSDYPLPTIKINTNEQCQVYYTIDGNTPTYKNALLYVDRVQLVKGVNTVKFFARDLAGNLTQVATEVYNVQDIFAPTITAYPPAGTYMIGSTGPDSNPIPPRMVFLNASEPNVTIYYTVDGSTPTTGSQVATGAIQVGSIPGDVVQLKYFGVDAVGNVGVISTSVYSFIAYVEPLFRTAYQALRILTFENGAMVLKYSLGLDGIQSNTLNYGTWYTKVQRICNKFTFGDPVNGYEMMALSILSESHSIQKLFSDVSEGMHGIKAHLHTLTMGDPLDSTHRLLASLLSESNGTQKLVSDVSEGLHGVKAHAHTLTLGDPLDATHILVSSLINESKGVQVNPLAISEGLLGLNKMLVSLTVGDMVTGIELLMQQVKDHNVGLSQIVTGLSSALEGVQGLKYALTMGDPLDSTHLLVSSLLSESKGIQVTPLELSEGLAGLHKMLVELSAADAITGIEILMQQVKDHTAGVSQLSNELSTLLKGVQNLSYALTMGDPLNDVQLIAQGIDPAMTGFEGLPNVLSDFVQRVQAVDLDNSEVFFSGVSALLSELKAKDEILGLQKTTFDVSQIDLSSFAVNGEPATMVPPVFFKLYLDGAYINNKVKDVTITYSQSSVHNTIDISCTDYELFMNTQVDQTTPNTRIEVQLGSRVLYFLLEEKTGNEKEFKLWGRSISAREDAPYRPSAPVYVSEAILASAYAQELAGTCALDWNVADFTLPISFTYTGTPVEGLTQLAKQVNAILRVMDDGSFQIVHRYRVRPLNLETAGVDAVFDRDTSIISMAYTEELHEKFTRMDVTGYTDKRNSPVIVQETPSPSVGQDVYLRIYYDGLQEGPMTEFVTDGTAVSLGFVDEVVKEVVEFKDGVGRTEKPIWGPLTNIAWEGIDCGVVRYVIPFKDVAVDDLANGIANITYTTRYERFLLSGHDVNVLMFILNLYSKKDIYVRLDSGVVPPSIAPVLNLPYVTTVEAATEAGISWLDENVYPLTNISLEVPYNDELIDGNLVYVDNSKLQIRKNAYITSSVTKISGVKITTDLNIVKPTV